MEQGLLTFKSLSLQSFCAFISTLEKLIKHKIFYALTEWDDKKWK